jgi:hypothetical protein
VWSASAATFVVQHTMFPFVLLSLLFVSSALGGTGPSVSNIQPVPLSTSDPQQIHLVFGADETQYVVQWVSFDTTPPLRPSLVRFGPSNTSLPYLAKNNPYLFIDDRCQTKRLMHNVTLHGLKPGSRVFYQVSSNGQVWSSVFHFVVFPRTSNRHRPMTLSLVGDMAVPPICQITSMDQWAIDSVSNKHDFVIHYGDIAYNLDDNCNVVGDAFMNKAQSVAAYTSYVFGVGNHETDKNYTYHTYLNRYAGQTPLAQASGSNSVRWLSFDAQLVHFVMFDTDAWIYPEVFHLAPPQLEWMHKDLAKVDRKVTPWIIVIGHRSMYCTKNTDPECNGEAEAIRVGFTLPNGTKIDGVEPLLLRYGADLYFGGHTHHYMRTWPVKRRQLMQKNYVNPLGPVHVQSGIGGVDGQDEFALPMKPYDAWRDDVHYYRSFSRLVVHNATHLTFTQHNAVNGTVFDSLVLQQQHHGPF